MARQSYHHGDLRRAFLDAAVEVIGESGPGAMSLRELARRAGVSHAASQHHFGDKAGLLTAVACQGYELLADKLSGAGDGLLDVGVAYVHFAATHRAHFEVMFQPSLYHADTPEVSAARERAGAALAVGLRRMPGRRGAASEHASVAAWSIVHGFASLWLAGVLPDGLGDDPEAAARPVIKLLLDQGG
ncbi:TetR/AcrR family transcriptional regulator [Streptomyces sp. HNM0645]|uniref:TetR/AcrR family transcriptional regulator n=1 Tax=Streptomyces sp. HNM0645 TaxID=2782343 RepID=UPI0024B7358F|nr:TetR/AcrR family transcriptional regulator [Streptomyces sp. HNM0645]MDI9886447.1 TetR/AcrR family transcriptional regulator [Streptomyces sp. HNM0645]